MKKYEYIVRGLRKENFEDLNKLGDCLSEEYGENGFVLTNIHFDVLNDEYIAFFVKEKEA